ncbi:glycoside hydrolase family 18 protein [Deinococcus misasensis]|uniref:glycoside hydrolase family 18 protein n=1 Tax=Deinococcus misasensis TaxID=392413 RepID=UPI0006900ED9|nr:glycoside hydrolase family 18 protein [Deinococcus misasensis]
MQKALLSSLLVLTISLAQAQEATDTPEPEHIVVGYYPSWGVYGKNYFVQDIPADKITHINYAFANVNQEGKCVLGDPWADVQNGNLGVVGEGEKALKGNFAAIKQLKAKHPNLKVMISVGGWTFSKYFSVAARTPESRKAFVDSCVNMFILGQFDGVDPEYGRGVFDGIDIDWEYPVVKGDPGNIVDPSDKRNYTLLMEDFREALNKASVQTGQEYQLSIAASANPTLLTEHMESAALADVLDFINIMSYDYHGSWDSTTNHHSALYASGKDPSGGQSSVDNTVQTLLNLGVNPKQIVVGVPFYGRSYKEVEPGNNGLYQKYNGAGPGTLGEAGILKYADILKLEMNPNYRKFRDRDTRTVWLYSKKDRVFVAYDDPDTLQDKVAYVKKLGLGGMMFWELSQDDSSLLNVMDAGLNP